MNEIVFIIPARAGSKRFPGKNRILFAEKADMLNDLIDYFPTSKILVSTDDRDILNQSKQHRFETHYRIPGLANDTASMKDVLLDIGKGYQRETIFVMLYLTFPQVTIKDIKEAVEAFRGKSLLCKNDLQGKHPYLMMFEDGPKGIQLVDHNLYREQDYPEVFEICHAIFICEVREINKLNKNLYNQDTYFYKIRPMVDVDTREDYQEYKRARK